MDDDEHSPGTAMVVARPGPAVAEALADAILAAKGDRPLHPVTVLVPSGIGLVRLRRDVAAVLGRRVGGIANLELSTLAAIAAERRPVDAPGTASRLALLAALARAAHDVGGALAPSAHEPATLLALAAAYRQVRDGGDAARRALIGRGRLAAEVAAITARAVTVLRNAGLADDVDRLASCTAGPVGGGALVILVDAPLPVAARDLLIRMQRSAGAAFVIAVATGDELSDAATLDTARSLAPVTSIGSAVTGAGPPASGALTLSDATDPDAEVRDAVRRLRQALVGGADATRCALVWTADDPYRRLVTEHLDRAGIPWTGPAGGSLVETAAGRVALAAAGEVAVECSSWNDWAGRLADSLPGPATTPATTPGAVEATDELDPVRTVLADLGRLDRVHGFPASPRLRRSRALGLLELALATTAPRRGARGVLVGSLDGAPGTLAYDVVTIVGMAEGWWPRPVSTGALLTDGDRAAAGLSTAADEVLAQRRRLFGLLAAAGATNLSWPRGDLRRTADRQPSRWLADVRAAAALVGRPLAELSQPSHLGAVLAAPSAAPADRRLALALASPDALAAEDTRFARARHAVLARQRPGSTAYDGNLADAADGVLDLEPLRRARPWTATELEEYLECPRTYFVRRVLRVNDDEPIDELLNADARRDGIVIHEALQRLVAAEQVGPDADRGALRAVLDAALEEAERSAPPRVGGAPTTVPPVLRRHRRRTMLARLTKVAEDDRARRVTSGRHVTDVEHPFGADDAVTVPLPDGRRLALRGRIDRIDRRDDGSAVVVDYKRRVRTDPKHELGGRGRMQVALYAAVTRELLGITDVGAELVDVHDARVHVVDTDLADHAAAALRIVQGVEAGHFRPPIHPPRGPGMRSCAVCDPYGLFERLLVRPPDPEHP